MSDEKQPEQESNSAKPGELTPEELAKVSGGAIVGGLIVTNQVIFRAPTGNTFKKG